MMKANLMVLCYLAMIAIMFSCANPEKPSEKDYGPLRDAALQTSTSYNAAGKPGAGGNFAEIPHEFWAQAIRQENPIRVYSHCNNIALVLEVTPAVEKGIYIYVVFSSYLPQDDAEITFTNIEQDVYTFTKKK